MFGASDGLVSNVSLILGVAGADASGSVVRLAGVAGLVAGAVSMAAGEWVSMQAQRELLEAELARERIELANNPENETAELATRYRARGLGAADARRMAEAVAADPEIALEVHAREELGVDPGSLGSPWGAAASSLVAFAAGALVPLVPWFWTTGAAATVLSIVATVMAAALLGGLLGNYTGRSVLFSAARQVAIAAGAAAVTYGVGSLFGVGVT